MDREHSHLARDVLDRDPHALAAGGWWQSSTLRTWLGSRWNLSDLLSTMLSPLAPTWGLVVYLVSRCRPSIYACRPPSSIAAPDVYSPECVEVEFSEIRLEGFSEVVIWLRTLVES